MSSEELRGLVEQVLQMRKVWDTCEADCTGADQAVKESSQFAGAIHHLFPKLRFLSAEIANQLELMETLKARITKRCQAAQTTFENLSAEASESHQNLERIFAVLRQRTVDPEFDRDSRLRSFVGKPKSSGPGSSQTAAEAVTLFDFVDVDSVTKLRNETNDELQELKKIAAGCGAISSSIAEQYQTFSTEYSNAREGVNFEDTNIDGVLRMTETQHKKSEKMAESLIAVAGQYRLGEDQMKKKAFDPRVVEEGVRKCQQQAAVIKESLDQLLKIRTLLERKQELIATSFEKHLKIFELMDGYGIEMAKHLSNLHDFEARVEKAKATIDGNLIEFDSLDAWYQQFYRAYNHLVLEIDRRCNYFETEQRLVNEFMQTLEINMKAETEKRKEFWQLYGQYLPEALCPAIKEFPQKRQIFLENPTFRLPKFSETVVLRTRKLIQEEEEGEEDEDAHHH